MEYIGLGFCLMLIGVAIGAIAGVVAEEILDERWRRKAQRRRPHLCHEAWMLGLKIRSSTP